MCFVLVFSQKNKCEAEQQNSKFQGHMQHRKAEPATTNAKMFHPKLHGNWVDLNPLDPSGLVARGNQKAALRTGIRYIDALRFLTNHNCSMLVHCHNHPPRVDVGMFDVWASGRAWYGIRNQCLLDTAVKCTSMIYDDP